MLRRVVAGLVLSLLVLSVLGPGVSGAGAGGSDASFSQSAPGEFTDTTFEITVFADGDGRWTIRHSRPLETEDEETQFVEFAEQFRTTETETFQNFRKRAARLTESGAESTGRNMTASDFRRDAFIDERGQTTGVVEMSFRWSEIAAAEGGGVVLADIFAGGWAITDGQWLVVQPGENAVFAERPVPDPDRGLEGVELAEASSVTWFGERQFADRRPRVVVASVPATGGDDTAADDTAGDGTAEDGTAGDGDGTDDAGEPPDDGSADEGMGMVPLAVGIVVLAGIGGGLAYYRRAAGADGDTAAADGAAAGATAGAAAGDDGLVSDAELLSDEDRVLRLLEQNGGRMKQVAIVEETEWSKSKVSMLLSDMESEGEISKLRVGRENIISLSGEEPEAAGSPFEDEE